MDWEEIGRILSIAAIIAVAIIVALIAVRLIIGKGFIQAAKANKIESDAQTAWNRGDKFFTPVMNYPIIRFGFSGAITDWSMMTESITSVGWVLHTWSTAIDRRGRPQAMPIFVRSDDR